MAALKSILSNRVSKWMGTIATILLPVLVKKMLPVLAKRLDHTSQESHLLFSSNMILPFSSFNGHSRLRKQLWNLINLWVNEDQARFYRLHPRSTNIHNLLVYTLKKKKTSLVIQIVIMQLNKRWIWILITTHITHDDGGKQEKTRGGGTSYIGGWGEFFMCHGTTKSQTKV